MWLEKAFSFKYMKKIQEQNYTHGQFLFLFSPENNSAFRNLYGLDQLKNTSLY